MDRRVVRLFRGGLKGVAWHRPVIEGISALQTPAFQRVDIPRNLTYGMDHSRTGAN